MWAVFQYADAHDTLEYKPEGIQYDQLFVLVHNSEEEEWDAANTVEHPHGERWSARVLCTVGLYYLWECGERH